MTEFPGKSEKIIIRRDSSRPEHRNPVDARPLHFLSKDGDPFRLNLNSKILGLLSDIAQKQGVLNALRISPDFLEARKKMIQKTEAYFSSILDTEYIPFDEAIHAMERRKTVFENPALQRIINNRLVLQKIYLLACRSGVQVAKPLIKELESILQGRTDSLQETRPFRDGPVCILDGTDQVVYEGPPPDRVEEMMPLWIDWMNAAPQNHPLIDAALGQLFFLHIHPLSDFNGCVARALTLFYLRQHGYDCVRLFSLSEALFHSRAAYYQAIHSAESEELDATVFVVYFLEVFLRQINDALDVLTKGPLAVSGLNDLLDRETRKSLNQRQTAALRWLIKNDQRLSTRIYRKLNKCSDETARKDFRKLIELDILRSVGAGRAVEYEIKPGEFLNPPSP